MKKTTADLIELIWVIIFIVVLTVSVTFFMNRDDKLIVRHSETLIDHNQRLLEIESHSGDLVKKTDNLESKLSLVQDRVSDMKLKSQSRLYNLEITICLLDKENDEIHKRKVTMNNILAINPSVDRTAVVVDVGIGTVEIPTIMDSAEEYACGLKVLSVR